MVPPSISPAGRASRSGARSRRSARATGRATARSCRAWRRSCGSSRSSWGAGGQAAIMLHAFVAILLLLAPAPTPAVVQQQWVPLGRRQVVPHGERDIVRTAGEGKFKHIRLVVDGGDLELFDVRITFGDGKTFSPTGRFSFTGKSRSRGIALPGAARTIRWINFFYRGNGTVHV